MKQLLIANCKLLEDTSKTDVSAWYGIYKLIHLNVSLVDRCDYIKFPYNFSNKFPMPVFDANFSKSYQEVCVERAAELLLISREKNLPIHIAWSGGIDSTALIISFMLAGISTSDQVVIYLNPASINENPNFYFNHIRNKFRIAASEEMLSLLNGQCLFVGGEFNDQLFGSDMFKPVLQFGGTDLLHADHTENNMTEFFVHKGMTESQAKIWYDTVVEHISHNCPIKIKKTYEFLWWLNFSFKWQSVYYRIPTRTIHRSLITDNFLSTYYYQFFNTNDFQQWSFHNTDKKIVSDWKSYKFAAKQFIFNYTQDQDYFDNKLKTGSLTWLFRQRTVPDALGIDNNTYEFIESLDKSVYYQPNNSFNL